MSAGGQETDCCTSCKYRPRATGARPFSKSKAMHQYRTKHRVVTAFQIIECGTEGVVTEDGYYREYRPGMTKTYIPRIGDFWVVDQNNQPFLMPNDVFSEKYERVAAND